MSKQRPQTFNQQQQQLPCKEKSEQKWNMSFHSKTSDSNDYINYSAGNKDCQVFAPGSARYGNFINYYSFNSVSERLKVIPHDLLSKLKILDEIILVLDVGCNSGVSIYVFLNVFKLVTFSIVLFIKRTL